MACLASRCMPMDRFCSQPRVRASPSPGARLIVRRDCRAAAGYKARIASLDEQETREYKIRKFAEILDCNMEQVHNLVKLHPGLLVVPNGDMSFYEQRVFMLALKRGLSLRAVQAMVIANPRLLFRRA